MPSSARSEDNSYACRIIREDRPCLVCPGKMDLVEAHPRFSFFSGLPLCSSESIDCLDCPKCGFSTSTTDYEYLQICKIQRHGMFGRSRRAAAAAGGGGGRHGSSSGDRKTRREKEARNTGSTCPTCNTALSSKWQFCPGCGSKCGTGSAVSPSIPKNVTRSTETMSKARSNTPSDTTSMDYADTSMDSHDSGIMRMVTPPKRHSVHLQSDGSL